MTKLLGLVLFLAVGLIVSSYGADYGGFDSAIRNLNQSDFDPQTDEIVVLPFQNGTNDFLQVKNQSNCLAITEANLDLMTSIKFNPSGGRDSPQEIQDKLKMALNSSGQNLVVINGYSKLEFMNLMAMTWASKDNPLRAAIEDYQKHHGLEVSSTGETKLKLGDPGMNEFRNNLKAIIKDSSKFLEEVQRKIDSRTPVSMAVFRTRDKVLAAEPAHALIVVGYIKKKGSDKPDRLLVMDPNFPSQLKVVQSEGGEWHCDLPKSDGSGFEKATVVPSVMEGEGSESRETAFQNIFSRRLSASLSSPTCRPEATNSIFQIFRPRHP
jgi:hypothetical protein